MKKAILLFLLSIILQQCKAQFGKNHAIYSTGLLSIGNYNGLDFNLNYAYQEKYSFKVGTTTFFRKARNIPPDYTSSFISILFLGLGEPLESISNLYCTVGRIYKLNPTGTLRLNLSAGLGYTFIGAPYNWKRKYGSFLDYNYTWDTKKYNTISLIINPKIEFPFTRIYGLTISPMIQINKYNICYGIGFGKMIGLLRNKLEIK